MDYYQQPEGTERMLHSRIRRGYVALAEMQGAIEDLEERLTDFCEEVAEKHLTRTSEVYRNAHYDMSGVVPDDTFHLNDAIQQAQERLMTDPLMAREARQNVESINEDISGVFRALEYKIDAGHIEPDNPQYQTIREQAIKILGLTDVVESAINPYFVQDVRSYLLYGE
ncbi:hypothetical protein ACKVMT_05395 [Halobacteriales archaeon Cl-PHB]